MFANGHGKDPKCALFGRIFLLFMILTHPLQNSTGKFNIGPGIGGSCCTKVQFSPELALVTMGVAYFFLAFLSVSVPVINAQLTNNSKGCHLAPLSGYDNIEPEGDPLLLHVRFRVLHIRDVPDSGGSFGVDIM